MSKRKNAKAEAKEKAKMHARAVEGMCNFFISLLTFIFNYFAFSEHKRFEDTLENCQYCIDSRKLQKQLIVATGLKVGKTFSLADKFF